MAFYRCSVTHSGNDSGRAGKGLACTFFSPSTLSSGLDAVAAGRGFGLGRSVLNRSILALSGVDMFYKKVLSIANSAFLSVPAASR